MWQYLTAANEEANLVLIVALPFLNQDIRGGVSSDVWTGFYLRYQLFTRSFHRPGDTLPKKKIIISFGPNLHGEREMVIWMRDKLSWKSRSAEEARVRKQGERRVFICVRSRKDELEANGTKTVSRVSGTKRNRNQTCKQVRNPVASKQYDQKVIFKKVILSAVKLLNIFYINQVLGLWNVRKWWRVPKLQEQKVTSSDC